MNERKLTKSELAKREDIIMKMKKNKRSLVQKYGKDAEAVMYGRATKLAKKQAESMDQDKIKELVKDALQNPKAADLNKDGKLSNYEKKRGAAIEKSMTNEVDRNDPKDKIPKSELKMLAQVTKLAKKHGFEVIKNPEKWIKKNAYESGIVTVALFLHPDRKFDLGYVQVYHEEGKPEYLDVHFYAWGSSGNDSIDSWTTDEYWKTYFSDESYTDGKIDEMDRNDPIAMRLRANKMKREKDAAKPKRRPLYGKQRQKVEDAILYIDQELKGLYSDKNQTLIDMEQEAETEGGPIANRYGNELNKIENQIQSLIAKKDKLEARLDETKSIADLREISGDKMEALMELRNILDELQVLGDQAREIISMNFPSHLSRGEAYGAFDMGSSSNRYDTTLASIVADIEEYGEDEDLNEDLDLGHQDNEPHMLKADLYRIGKYAMELYQMLDKFEAGSEEVDLPHWWQSKIIKSKDAIVGAKHYLDFEIKEPQIDAMVDVAAEEDVIDESQLGIFTTTVDPKVHDGNDAWDIFLRDYARNKGVSDEELGKMSLWDMDNKYGDKAKKEFNLTGRKFLDFVRQLIKQGQIELRKEAQIDEFDDKSMTAYQKAVKKVYRPKYDGSIQMPSQEEVDAFFKKIGQEDHHLANKPVFGDLEPWDDYDYSNWKSITRGHKLNEGVWSLGSAKSIKNIIGILDMALDIKDPQELMDLMDMHDKSMYNIVGDDTFHDDIDGAKRELAQNNLDRAYNRLIDAKGRAKDLLKIASENDLKDPSIFEGIAKKLAKQLKSK